jgi:hypothetical protein
MRTFRRMWKFSVTNSPPQVDHRNCTILVQYHLHTNIRRVVYCTKHRHKRRNCVYILYYSLSSKRATTQLKRNSGEDKEDVEDEDEVEVMDAEKTLFAYSEMEQRLIEGHTVVFVLKNPTGYVPVKLYKRCEGEKKGQ